jgi:RNA polymerase sigma-70 factor (ECF subfamily)
MNIEKIWSQYQLSLTRFLKSKVSNEADVEDLLQEILIKTYTNFSSIKNQASIKSWLFQVAHNVIIDFYRKKGRVNMFSAQETWLMDESNEVKSALSDCISPFIKALPKEHSQLLIAIDINGQSQKDYAQSLGISYSTLKSRVQKSRSLLKGIFDDCCHFQIDKGGNDYDYDKKKIDKP